jgi:hypothetical protein
MNNLYCLSQTSLALTVASLVIQNKEHLDEAPMTIRGGGVTAKMIDDLKPREIRDIMNILADICGYDTMSQIYIGTEAYVTDCLANIDKAPRRTRDQLIQTQIERRFAIGIHTLLKWSWDKNRLRTVPKNNYFHLYQRDPGSWIIMTKTYDDTPIGFKTSIGVENSKHANMNIMIWKAERKYDIHPPTDEELFKQEFPSPRSNNQTISEIWLPNIEPGQFTRSPDADKTSVLINKEFGRSQYYIKKFKQTASLSMNSEGGIAEATTIIVVERTTSIMEDMTHVLDLTEVPIYICITAQHKDVENKEFVMFMGYYSP